MVGEIKKGKPLSLEKEILLDCYKNAIKESHNNLRGYAGSLKTSVVAIVPIYSGFITLIAGFRENFQFNWWLLTPVVPLIFSYLFCTAALLPETLKSSFDLTEYGKFRNNRLKTMKCWFVAASILFAAGLFGMPACLILFLN